MKTKVIANYLPQYHSIPENDRWWGKGYTDWTAVKNTVPFFDSHVQPKRPFDGHYYSLDNIEAIRWQATIAKKYGVHGFGIYHYWFNSEMHLLDKPVILLRDNTDIDISYMFIWDNSTWKRTWSNVDFSNDWAPLYENEKNQSNNGILAELIYGSEKDWKIHFDYLLDFFMDSRYIKIDNKPVFAIYNQNNRPDVLKRMCDYWNQLAIKSGFNGIYILGKTNKDNINITSNLFNYEPEWSGWLWHNQAERILNKLYKTYFKVKKIPVLYNYDLIWKRIIKNASNGKANILYSAFVNYDDTPRRGLNGKVIRNESPEKFEQYMSQLLNICNEQNKEFLFITAWNEWGEGAYLEPDEENGYAYLEALKRAVDSVNRDK